MGERRKERLDRLEAAVDAHRRRLTDHEAATNSVRHSDYCGDFQHGLKNTAVSALENRFSRRSASSGGARLPGRRSLPLVKTRNNHYQSLVSHSSKRGPQTGVGLASGGLLAVLGLAATGTASANPQGQAGTADQPVETVYAAALAGPLTDDKSLESLVGDGLDSQDGTLTLAGGN